MTMTASTPQPISKRLVSGIAVLILVSLVLIGAMLSYAIPAIAHAATAPVVLTLRILKEKRTTATDGSTTVTLVPATRAIPGDRLVYTLTYANTGTQPVADLVVNYPLPAGVTYRAAADGSPAPQLASDGNGKPSALRWLIPGSVAPGSHGDISFKATFN